jgi:hypothetical protein
MSFNNAQQTLTKPTARALRTVIVPRWHIVPITPGMMRAVTVTVTAIPSVKPIEMPTGQQPDTCHVGANAPRNSLSVK